MHVQQTVDASVRRTSKNPLTRLGELIDRTPLWRTAMILGLVATALGFLGSWSPSYWGDEAASVMSAERSWPSLFRLLSSIDAVHGVYYMFLHVWIDLFGSSEISTRLPSAVAAGAMVAGVVVLAGRMSSARLALIAGIVATVLPRTMYMAIEARAYSMSAAIAVWATVLLLSLLRRERSRWIWGVYAVVLAVGNYVFLYLGLLLLVHGIVVLTFHRNRLVRWVVAAGGSLLLSLPIIVLGYLERGQIGFLARRNYATAWNVYSTQWFDPLLAPLCWALVVGVVLALVRSRRRAEDEDRRVLAVLSLIWLVLPTAVLLLGNALLSPMYNIRYLSFCVPAAAILVALGIGAVSQMARERWRPLTAAAVVTILMLAAIPSYVVQRGPYAKDDGSDWRDVAAYLEANARPGNSVIFDQKTKPSRSPRLMVSLYPERFEGLDDAALVEPFETQPHLWDKVVLNNALTAEDLSPDVWAVEITGKSEKIPEDVTHLQHLGYEIASSTLVNRIRVFHLVKP